MIKKKKQRWIWIPLLVLLISNWSAFKSVTGLNNWYYRYSNISGSVTVLEIPIKGIRYSRYLKEAFILDNKNPYSCIKEHPNDTIVYRLFKINPIKFWRWGEYIFNWRYRLPYTDWEAIKKKRGFGYLKISNGCMVF